MTEIYLANVANLFNCKLYFIIFNIIENITNKTKN